MLTNIWNYMHSSYDCAMPFVVYVMYDFGQIPCVPTEPVIHNEQSGKETLHCNHTARYIVQILEHVLLDVREMEKFRNVMFWGRIPSFYPSWLTRVASSLCAIWNWSITACMIWSAHTYSINDALHNFTFRQVQLEWLNQGKRDGHSIKQPWGRSGRHTGFRWNSQKEINH
jgi:hypothetical protein